MSNKPPERFLTDDEVVEFPVRGNDTPFRIRVWQGRDHCPFVVVSQVIRPDGLWPGPSHATHKLANFVYSAVLTYPSYPMLYQEDEFDGNGVPILTCYGFELHGSFHRWRLHRPSRRVRTWHFVEYLLRQKVERWP